MMERGRGVDHNSKRNYDDYKGGDGSRDGGRDLRDQIRGEQRQEHRQDMRQDQHQDQRAQDCGRSDWGPPPPWWVEKEKREERNKKKKAAAAKNNQQREARKQGEGSGAQETSKGKDAQVADKSRSSSKPGGSSGQPVAAPKSGGLECFNCWRQGHFQADCKFEALCLLYKQEGHVSACCPSLVTPARMQLMGSAFAGGGFYCLDIDPSEAVDSPDDKQAAVIAFEKTPLSAQELDAELKHLVDGAWDWKVEKV